MKKSTYHKKGKVPFKYSSNYNDWKDAAKRGDEKGMELARERINRNFPLPQHDT